MRRYELDENNSGGSWWLTRAQYDALHAAGWHKPNKKEESSYLDTADVPYAWRHNTWGEFESLQKAVESFEAATGEDFFAQGCNCCGVPFSIHTPYNDKPYESISGSDAEACYARPF